MLFTPAVTYQSTDSRSLCYCGHPYSSHQTERHVSPPRALHAKGACAASGCTGFHTVCPFVPVFIVLFIKPLYLQNAFPVVPMSICICGRAWLEHENLPALTPSTAFTTSSPVASMQLPATTS